VETHHQGDRPKSRSRRDAKIAQGMKLRPLIKVGLRRMALPIMQAIVMQTMQIQYSDRVARPSR
jgi:hypothetical protein